MGPDKKLLIDTIEIDGYAFRAIIDTRATASFVPLQGKIMKQPTPSLEEAAIKLQTIGNSLMVKVFKTILSIRPNGEQVGLTTSEVSAPGVGNNILGCDIVVGLAELASLKGSISFLGEAPAVSWHLDASQHDHYSAHHHDKVQPGNTYPVALVSHTTPEEYPPDTVEPPRVNNGAALQAILEDYKDIFAKSLNG